MNLTAITHSLELVTSSANTLTWAVSWTDIDKTGATVATPGSSQGTVSAATTTTMVSAPGANIYRIVTGVTLLASGGAQTPQVQKDVSSTNYPVARALLSVNEALCYEDAEGWYSMTAAGERRGIGATGPAGTNGGGTVLGSGTSIVDFGSAGTQHTTLAVTGLASILAGSLVFAWVKPEATLDHTADEHVAEDIRVYASDITAGVGFTLHAVAGSDLFSVDQYQRLARFAGVGQDFGPGRRDPNSVVTGGGKAPMIKGLWSVAWLYTQ